MEFKTFSRETVETLLDEVADACVSDKKNRDVGFRVKLRRVLWTETPEADWGFPQEATTKSFVATVQQTRGGRTFGALQPEKAFETQEEAEKWITKTVARRIKAAQKNAIEWRRKVLGISETRVGTSKPPLDADTQAALLDWRGKYGQSWKVNLRIAWLNATAPPILHRLRNTHGEQWLATQ